jgi:hypothetical protein
MVTNKLTWGDDVIVKVNAPKEYNPSAVGSICGIRTIETCEDSQEFSSSLGESVYLVEFSNGCSIEIPGSFLLKYLPD